MRKIAFGVSLLLIILFSASATHREAERIYLRFPEEYNRTGLVSKTVDHELTIHPDRWFRITVPVGESVYSCSLDISLSSQISNRSGLSITGLQTSHADKGVFKIKLGRIVIEKHLALVRVLLLDPTQHTIQTILKEVRLSTPLSAQLESNVTLTIIDRVLTVYSHEHTVLQCELYGYSFETIELGSYSVTYTVFSLDFYSLRRSALITNKNNGWVEFSARFKPSHFKSQDGMKNHHLVAWKDGFAAPHALFSASISAEGLESALREIGLESQENLTIDSWEKLALDGVSAPDRRIKGDPINIEILFRGKIIPLVSVLVDIRGKDIRLHYGGNPNLIRHFDSGCLVCLQSCPAGVVGNSEYSMRDWYRGGSGFKVLQSILQEGDEVSLRVRAGS